MIAQISAGCDLVNELLIFTRSGTKIRKVRRMMHFSSAAESWCCLGHPGRSLNLSEPADILLQTAVTIIVHRPSPRE